MGWYLLVVFLHIVAACVWIGGMVFLAAVLLPALRMPEYRAVALPLIRLTAERFRWVGWAAVATLVGTGIASLAFRGYGWAQLANGTLWQGWFGHVLAVKFALVAVIVMISGWHDLVAGPQATRLGTDPASLHATLRLRRRAAWVGRIVLLLSLAVVILGTMLVRGVP